MDSPQRVSNLAPLIDRSLPIHCFNSIKEKVRSSSDEVKHMIKRKQVIVNDGPLTLGIKATYGEFSYIC